VFINMLTRDPVFRRSLPNRIRIEPVRCASN